MNTPASSHSSTQAEVWAALDPLTDPEIPVITLREMGILREVRQGGDGVTEVVITPTYSGCPAMGQIEDDVRAALAAAGVVVGGGAALANRGALCGQVALGHGCALPPMRLIQHHRDFPLWLHSLQGAIPLPRLHGTVRLLQTLLIRQEGDAHPA